MPFAARMARKDGEALFDLVAGFVHSQVLRAFVELDLSGRLASRPKRAEELALEAGLAARADACPLPGRGSLG
jgi:demethylspheroidene O-methyltransferase